MTPATPEMKITMIVLGITDPARSAKFHSETLGLTIMGKPSDVTLFRAGDLTLVLNQGLSKAPHLSLTGAVEVVFPVASVAEARSQFGAKGCNFVAEPHEVMPGMWAATFTDPDDHWLTLFGGK